MFESQVNDSQRGGLVAEYPHDFSLFEVGSFDDTNGSVESLKTPNRLITGLEASKTGASVTKISEPPSESRAKA